VASPSRGPESSAAATRVVNGVGREALENMAIETPNQNDRRGPSLAFIPEDEVDLLSGYGRPNPTRAGCPSHDELVALSRRERPIGDGGYAHTANCSPCYRELRSLQLASAEHRRKRFKRFSELRRRLRWWWAPTRGR
jgi:hypothetical protein